MQKSVLNLHCQILSSIVEAVDRSEHEIENIDTMIKGAEIVMKSNLPKLFRDAVPTLDSFSNAIERIADVRMIYILLHVI